jgi:hypothetical protein
MPSANFIEIESDPKFAPKNTLRWLTALWRGYCPSSLTPTRQRFQWLSFASAAARELTAVWLALRAVLGAKPMQWRGNMKPRSNSGFIGSRGKRTIPKEG